MELFSEIYNAYYNAVSQILKNKITSAKDAVKIIKNSAFNETDFFILPKIKSNDLWHFIRFENNCFISNLTNIPFMPLTLLEKRWIKAVINDEKALLFMDKSEINTINQKLENIQPLYEEKYFHYFDMHSDGDNFSDINYIRYFRTILNAIKEKRILEIDFISGKNNPVSHKFLPFRIEFSAKNNKFRVYAAQMKGNYTYRISVINISRITDIRPTDAIYFQDADMNRIFKNSQCKEPVRITILPERNAVERFMMEFADCQKKTEYDKISGVCKAALYFDTKNETEILIKLLSFGPVIKIDAPQSFINLFEKRLENQNELFKLYNHKSDNI